MEHRTETSNQGKDPLVIVGGGGHGLVVAEAADESGHLVVGFLDDDPDAVLGRLPKSILRVGGLSDLSRIGDRRWILGLGGLAFRAQVLQRLESRAGQARSVVHPTAYVSPSARIGAGVYIGPRAIVHSRAVVMDHAIINSGAIVEHECVIGSNAHIAPGTVLAGNVRVGMETLIGVGSRVLPSLSIGERCVVGAGAVVIRSVLDGQTVVGVPAGARHG